MEIKIIEQREGDVACSVLILPLFEGVEDQYPAISDFTTALLRRVFTKEFSGKRNEVLLIPAPADIKPERLLLVGLGKREEVSPERMRQAGGKAAGHLRGMNITDAVLSSFLLVGSDLSAGEFVEGFLLGLYSFDKYRKEENRKKPFQKLSVLQGGDEGLRTRLRHVETVASAVNYARDLVNTPANEMTPSRLAECAKALEGGHLMVKILEREEASALGMGAFLAVAKGSEEPPKFIVLEYRKGEGAPVVLIGKSITFDSGGLSLKPVEGMEKMKYDMAGGAAVLGVLKAVAEMDLPLPVVGILPATENLPGGSATRPGDVVTTVGGKTIEIVNTDAEGRLVIADALGYAEQYKPRAIVDIATLTGACVIAFGAEAVAMMGNDRSLLDRLKAAGEHTYERVWEMPLFEEYEEYLKSDIADLKNTGGRSGSLAASAYFLFKFAGNGAWAHLDIAGTAWADKDKPYVPKGATGIGVRLMLNYLERMLGEPE